jgi:acetate kinase
MGFSALDGMPMGTRSGQLDPGVILHFLDRGMSADEITTLLYKESGLLGLSGLSHDMRTLLASDMKEAAEAIDYYTFRLRREIGAMAAILGGLDALVFTGGIGENSPDIRARGLEKLAFLGLEIDPGPTRKTPRASTRARCRSSSCPPTRNASSRAPRPPRSPDPLHLSKIPPGGAPQARGQSPHLLSHERHATLLHPALRGHP